MRITYGKEAIICKPTDHCGRTHKTRIMKAGINKIAIKLGDFYNREVKSKTSELSLHFDPGYHPDRHINTKGKIASLPYKVDEEWVPFLDSIQQAEYLYFDYKALNEDEFVQNDQKEKIYFVDIDMVFCATDSEEKEIYPNTGWAVCSPFFGFGYIEEDGRIIKERNGIVIDVNPNPDERIAKIEAFGPVSTTDFPQDIHPGDLVFRDASTNYEYEINYKKLYVVRHENIAGVLSGHNFAHTRS